VGARSLVQGSYSRLICLNSRLESKKEERRRRFEGSRFRVYCAGVLVKKKAVTGV